MVLKYGDEERDVEVVGELYVHVLQQTGMRKCESLEPLLLTRAAHG